MAAKKKASKKKVSKKKVDAPVVKKMKKKAPGTTKKAAPGTAKKKKAAPAKAKAAKKAPAAKNAFGHRKGTLTDVMDGLLLKGTTLEAGAEAMVEFKGGEADAKSCARQIKTHIKYLQDKKGADVSFMKKSGKYKVTAPDA